MTRLGSTIQTIGDIGVKGRSDRPPRFINTKQPRNQFTKKDNFRESSVGSIVSSENRNRGIFKFYSAHFKSRAIKKKRLARIRSGSNICMHHGFEKMVLAR